MIKLFAHYREKFDFLIERLATPDKGVVAKKLSFLTLGLVLFLTASSVVFFRWEIPLYNYARGRIHKVDSTEMTVEIEKQKTLESLPHGSLQVVINPSLLFWNLHLYEAVLEKAESNEWLAHIKLSDNTLTVGEEIKVGFLVQKMTLINMILSANRAGLP